MSETERGMILRLCGLLEGDINRGIVGANTYAPLIAFARAKLDEADLDELHRTERGVMMKLFEIYTGWTGESYERVYVWAKSEENARCLFTARYDGIREIVNIQEMLDSDDAPFITEKSDCGFGDRI